MPLIVRKKFQGTDTDDLISELSVAAGDLLLEKKVQGIWITGQDTSEETTGISFSFLQSAGLRITRTEFISCPTCARTSYDLQKVLSEVQMLTSHLPGLKIAVMGCIVNGPGEMADADFGFVGTGSGKLHLYKGRQPIIKNIDPAEAPAILLETLIQNGYPGPGSEV